MEKISSRKDNSIRNTLFGIANQAIHLILSFICRTILIKKLGSEILGINGLYTDILNILSLAELGIGNVMLYSLYKPLAEKNNDKVNAIIRFYEKIYVIIALVIFVLGMALVPFLKDIVSTDILISTKDLIIYYLIFLFNTCVSYILVYKQALINADQKNYIIKISNTITTTLQYAIQITLLFVFPNYKVYLVVSGVLVLLQNIVLSWYANKLYPEINQRNVATIDDREKKEIKKNIFSTFTYKIGAVLIKNTDAILISTIVSTIAVGLYSNYNMIVTAINGFINMIIYGVFASIGNLGAINDKEKSLHVFNSMILLFQYIAFFCALCFVTVFNRFITIWLGAEFLLDMKTVMVISLSFFISTSISPVWVFRENFGLFKQVKYLMLTSAGLNIGLSILFGKLWGVFGILLATIVARLITTFTFEPMILYKNVFNKSPLHYYIKQIVAIIVYIMLSFGMLYLAQFMPSNFGGILLIVLINFVVVTALFCVTMFKTKEFKYLIDIIKNIVAKVFKKNKKQS